MGTKQRLSHGACGVGWSCDMREKVPKHVQLELGVSAATQASFTPELAFIQS